MAMPELLSSLFVANPAGLWALLTLLIPVMIHLINRSRGRLVRIGHIELIRKARKLQVTEIKLTQRILLALRVGILLLLALILAGLARPGLFTRDQATIYVTPTWLKTTDQHAIDQLFSNTKNGTAAVVVLEAGFPQLEESRVNTMRGTSTGSVDSVNVNLSNINAVWPLLTERLSLVRHEGPISVYATDYFQQFGVSRPALPQAVEWVISHPDMTPIAEQLSISAVVAHDDDRSTDAALISNALRAIKAHRLPGLVWELVNTDQFDIAQVDADWLILLSARPVDENILAGINAPTVILTDAGDGAHGGDTLPVKFPFFPFTSFRLNRLGALVTDKQAKDQMLIRSSAGLPVLQLTMTGTARWLQFNSRFNPDWSTLTEQAEFPELLLQLLLPASQQISRFPDARIEPGRLDRSDEDPLAGQPLTHRSLQTVLTLLLALLWVLERWLSERARTRSGQRQDHSLDAA